MVCNSEAWGGILVFWTNPFWFISNENNNKMPNFLINIGLFVYQTTMSYLENQKLSDKSSQF